MRKKTSSSDSPFTPPEGGKGRKFLTYVITISILGIVAYYIYSKSQPSETIVVEQEIPEQKKTETSDQVDVTPPLEQKVQVEILNGCGVRDIAKDFETILRKEGFDVVSTANYVENGRLNWKVTSSRVVDLTGDVEQAEKVAKILGISQTHVLSQSNADEIYDLRIIIGHDYKDLDSYKSFLQ
jgi:hypothetical protein